MFYPATFYNYDRSLVTWFTCPVCNSITQLDISWDRLQDGFAGNQILRTVQISPHYYSNRHFQFECGSCNKSYTAYLASEDYESIIVAVSWDEATKTYPGSPNPPPGNQYLKRLKPDLNGDIKKGPDHYLEKCFDGAFWEIDVPKGWYFDKYRNGYIFESENGCVIGLNTRKGVIYSDAYERIKLPSEGMSYAEASAYRTTWVSADKVLNREAPLIRHQLGSLSGYVYKEMRSDCSAWVGWFGYDDWSIGVTVLTPINCNDCWSSSQAIIASMKFYQPGRVGT